MTMIACMDTWSSKPSRVCLCRLVSSMSLWQRNRQQEIGCAWEKRHLFPVDLPPRPRKITSSCSQSNTYRPYIILIFTRGSTIQQLSSLFLFLLGLHPFHTVIAKWRPSPTTFVKPFSMKRYLTTYPGKTAEASSSRDSPSPGRKKARPTLAATDFLHVCSYNVDGLDSNLLLQRAGEVCSILLEETPDRPLPDVILLQEVVEANLPVFVSRLTAAGYEVAPPPSESLPPYFTLAFFKTCRIHITSAVRMPFPGSRMGRDLIKVQGRLNEPGAGTHAPSAASLNPPSDSGPPALPATVDLLFMTAHLESLGDPLSSEQRSHQLGHVLETLIAFPGPGLFAGDTNLREKEVRAEGRYKLVIDAWVADGSPKTASATWDMAVNDNKKMETAGFKPRMRLDRLLLNGKWGDRVGGQTLEGSKEKGGARREKDGEGRVKGWRLLGRERMAEGVFPSDHFGISCCVRLPPQGGESAEARK